MVEDVESKTIIRFYCILLCWTFLVMVKNIPLILFAQKPTKTRKDEVNGVLLIGIYLIVRYISALILA